MDVDRIKELIGETVEAKVKAKVEKEIKPYQDAMFEKLNQVKPNKMLGVSAGDDDYKGSLSFEDAEGKIHKAISSKERLYTGEEDFSIGKIVRAKILGDFTDLNSYETKAAGEGVGALGGWLVPETISSRLVDLARNKSCVMQAGATTMPMPTPEMRLVKLVSDPTAHFRAEHAAITVSDWQLEPLNLKAMTCGCLVKSSIELLEDAKNASSMLEASMSAAIALEMDRVALYGSGTNEPSGLDVLTDVETINKGTNGATVTTYDDFSNAVEDIYDNNGVPNAVIMAPRTYFTIDRLKQGTTNDPLVGPESYQNLKKFVTNQVGITDTQGTSSAASKAFVGDYKQILYAIRKSIGIEIAKSGATDTFAKCEVQIRLRTRFDIAVLRPNHFCKIYGIIV
ncbi:phage major capsid protein [Candidatus Atribacteria bacterium 1244-E10-H5-B2]|nr:MAG: phage major capsid protein [Candidatus Atribacteria bacterium 1244-E10-H5-B2]